MSAVAVEREVKFSAGLGFVLPDLGVDDGVTAERLAPQHLDATYYDTVDLRLTRAGLSLRHRSVDGEPAGWTLKLDPRVSEGALVREEVDLVAPPGTVPEALRAAVTAFTRGGALGPVARLRSERHRVVVRGPEGEPVAEVDDDTVVVLGATGDEAARFRQVEVEARADARTLYAAVVDRLRGAGAGAPDPTPKLVRALGPRALAPPDVSTVALGPGATVAELVRACLSEGTLRILHHDPLVRLDLDPEGVHQMRVGCRRLRSDLRMFAAFCDPVWAEGLRADLRDLAGVLGRLRDLDVQQERLRGAASTLDPQDRDAASGLLGLLDAERAGALDAVHAALSCPAYVSLLDRLVDACWEPAVLSVASRPAAGVAPGLVAAVYARLAKAHDRLGGDPPDAALHRVRILAKRARYAAEAVAPVCPGAGAHARALKDLQDVLGELHDAVVAEQWLRAAAAAEPAGAFVAGLLVGVVRADAAALRRRWPSAYRAVARKKVRAWLG